MSKEEQNKQLLALIGERRMTARQIADEGGCIVVNGCQRVLAGRIKRLVDLGVLRKVKATKPKPPASGKRFGDRPCEWAYEVAGEK